MIKVAVIGLGYVGKTICKRLSEIEDFDVIGIDKSRAITKSIEMTNPGYKVSRDESAISGADVFLVCVGTPLASGFPNDHHVIAAAKQIERYGSPGALAILESTVSIDVMMKEFHPVITRAKMLAAYSPERINPLDDKYKIEDITKLVAGTTPEATDKASNFYKKFINNVISTNDVRAVAAAKLLENSYRLINIAFINEFASSCVNANIDPEKVIRLASTKEFGFEKFTPSAKAGGHCIPIDPAFLSYYMKNIGSPMPILESAIKSNDDRASLLLNKIEKKYGSLNNKKVLIVGIAYKPNSDDSRNSAGIEIFNLLKSRRVDVLWHDNRVGYVDSIRSKDITEYFDVAIVTVHHDDTDLSGLRKDALIIDISKGTV